jgi:signal transduction histidine kinase
MRYFLRMILFGLCWTAVLPLSAQVNEGMYLPLTALRNTAVILIIVAIGVGLYFVHRMLLQQAIASYRDKIHELEQLLGNAKDKDHQLKQLTEQNNHLEKQFQKELELAQNQIKEQQDLVHQYKKALDNQAIELEKKEQAFNDAVKELEIKTNQLEQLQKASAEVVLLQQSVQQLKAELDQKNARLAQSQQMLQQQRAALEAKSAEAAQQARNSLQKAELEQKNAELAEAYEIIRKQKEQLVQSEKMAIIGSLTPAIAHEFNNPLGVLKNGATMIQTKLDIILKALPEWETKLSPERRKMFWDMIFTVLAGTTGVSPDQERKIRSKIERDLEDHDVDEAGEIATQIVRMGLHEQFQQFMSFFSDRFSVPAFKIVYEIDFVLKQIGRMKMSGNMAQKIIDALKGYVHDKEETFSLEENLETVLTLYDFRLNQGNIMVNRNFEPLPKMHGFPGQLMQVWTNFLSNAEHALKERAKQLAELNASDAQTYQPQLNLTIKREGTNAILIFEDNGTGIPAEIQDKVFDQLFTTKSRGEGTGYGLSLVKEIIERHKGKLTLDSEPGRTTFIIEFPLIG